MIYMLIKKRITKTFKTKLCLEIYYSDFDVSFIGIS